MTVSCMKTALISTLRSNWARFVEKPKIRKGGYLMQTTKTELNSGPKHLRLSHKVLKIGGNRNITQPNP